MIKPKQRRFQSSETAATFKAYAQPAQGRLLDLRALIFDTATKTEGVGALTETLKWGQPAYLTPETKSGSTIRIDAIKTNPEQIALYFHCQTGLVPAFRDMYGDTLTLVGNRSILLDVNDPLPEAELRHCISQALTYHLAKKKKQRSA